MFDFVRFAQEHHVDLLPSGHHHCHDGWTQTHCPQCSGGRSGWHLGFRLDGGYFNCWRCGRIKINDVIIGLINCNRSKANDLRKKYDKDRRTQVPRKQPVARTRAVPEPPGLSNLKGVHKRYLKSRGLKKITQLISLWELRATSFMSGVWDWRVVAPVKSRDGKLLSFLGRSVIKSKTKYRMTEDEKCAVNPASLLYGIHKVPGDSIIIVEGPGDVWKWGPGTVGTLGIDWHISQANVLREYKRRFIMYDPGDIAQKKANELADWLSAYPGVTEIIDGMSTDPGDVPYKEVRRIRRDLLGASND